MIENNDKEKEMKEQFQKNQFDYARISITDRCNLYCTYCRPDHEEMLSHGEILRYEEILRVCRIFLTTLGIDKFKITEWRTVGTKKVVQILSVN